MKYDEPEVENVARGRSPRATFSTSGSSYFNVTLTTVHNLYNAVLLFVLSIRHNYTVFYKKANIL